MKDNFVASPWARKATKKAFNEILKKSFRKESNADKKVLIKQIIENNSKIYFRKSRPDNEGAIMEIDASKDYWLGQIQSHLYAGYDPATKKIYGLHLEKEETTHGYYSLFNHLLKDKKVPRLLKGDCRSTFVINKRDAGSLAYKDVNTQFGFILKMLDIKMENSSEPTFKGSIERFFRTAQNHLKGEFRENKITSFEQANKFLKKYMDWWNEKYSIKPKSRVSFFKKIELSDDEINELLSIRDFRKTDKANSISFKNNLYSLFDKNNNRVVFKEKTAILVLNTFDNKLKAKYFGETLIMKLTDYKNLTKSQKFDYDNCRKLRANFSAPDDHPWGYKIFMLHLNSTNNLKRYLKK